jgi:hypothetical protein
MSNLLPIFVWIGFAIAMTGIFARMFVNSKVLDSPFRFTSPDDRVSEKYRALAADGK